MCSSDLSETAVFEAQPIEGDFDSLAEADDEQSSDFVSAETTIVTDEPLVADDMINTEPELKNGWTTAFEPLADIEQEDNGAFAEEPISEAIEIANETEGLVEEEPVVEVESVVEEDAIVEEGSEQAPAETFEPAPEFDTVFDAEPNAVLQTDEEQADI